MMVMFEIPSSSVVGVTYWMNYDGLHWFCSCPAHHRYRVCKHTQAMEMALAQHYITYQDIEKMSEGDEKAKEKVFSSFSLFLDKIAERRGRGR